MQRILIKTYCFESGLYYLAKSLGDILEEDNNIVYYAPKAKYLLRNNFWQRTYPAPHNPEEFKDVLRFSEKNSVTEQLSAAIEKYDIDVIISFETLMEKSNWVYNIKEKYNVEIIDVPMIEWVSKKYLNNGMYQVFDEIWAITDQCAKHFAKYEPRKMLWDFVDNKIFYPPAQRKGDVVFYHTGSLDRNYSTKNTAQVISAFDKFSKKHDDAKLFVTGLNYKFLIENHTNIIPIREVLSRKVLADLYRKSDIVIAPSAREGLGLCLYEAERCNCKIITTDASPMSDIYFKYLCKVSRFQRDGSLIPLAIVEEEEIFGQIQKAYEDVKSGRRST